LSLSLENLSLSVVPQVFVYKYHSLCVYLCDIYTQRLVRVHDTMSLPNLLHIRKEVEMQGNILESPCVGVCTMFGKKN
jgi:hypothetical protein